MYLSVYNDAGMYKINLNNQADITLIDFCFTYADKSQTGSGTCANYMFMVIGYDYQIKPDDSAFRPGFGVRIKKTTMICLAPEASHIPCHVPEHRQTMQQWNRLMDG
jgi:hypothetical protein